MENLFVSDTRIYLWMGILAFCLLSSCLVLSIDTTNANEYSNKKNFRKISRKNVIKDTLNEMIVDNIDYKKRKKTEKLLIQAGFDMTPADLYLLSLGSAFILSFLFYFVLNNSIVGAMMFLIGLLLPKILIEKKRNKRVEKLNTQVGTFINVVVGRYEMLNDFSEALRLSIDECSGQEPIASEIKNTIMDLDLGISVNEALENLTLRTGNKHIEKLTNNYKISMNIGTKEARKKLLGYVIDEYNKETVSKAQLKRELKGPVMEAYLMAIMVPGVMFMQATMTDGYVEFMTQDIIGQIGMAFIIGTVLGSMWFISAKVGAPLD